MKFRRSVAAGAVVAALGAAMAALPAPAGARHQGADVRAVPGPGFEHLVVIYEENHSFANLWGGWPGVDGLTPGSGVDGQVGEVGRSPLPCLPQDDVNLTSPPLHPVCSGTLADGSRFASHFPNRPFPIDDVIPPTGPRSTTCHRPTGRSAYEPPDGTRAGAGATGGCTRDLVHRFYQEQYQIDGGRQDDYVTGSDAAGLTMGVYDTTRLPLYRYLHGPGAPHYVIADHFFQGAFGGSFLNHQFLIAAAPPLWPGAESGLHSVVDADGMPDRTPLYRPSAVAGREVGSPMVRDGVLTEAATSPTGGACVPPAGAVAPPAGTVCGDWAVNTVQPASEPYWPDTPVGKRLPSLDGPTIGDRLSARGVSWAWYSGGWDNAAGIVNGPGWTSGRGPRCAGPTIPGATWPYCPEPLFQFHHQPFNYFRRYRAVPDGRGRETNPERLAHLRDEAGFTADARAGRLPAVSFVKPLGEETEHPGYTGVGSGDEHLVSLLRTLAASPQWPSTVVVVTYDEFGGQWDPVPPPRSGNADRFGPGTRIPAMVVSPLLRQPAAVDHSEHDTTSILATIEHRWSLPPLSRRDAAAADLMSAFSAALPRL